MAIQIGKHIGHIEDDILFLELGGDLTPEEARTYLQLAEGLVERYGCFYIVDNIANFGAAPPEVRRMVADWLAKHSCAGAALVGGSITARTVALLVLGIMRMLGKQSFPVEFVKTEQDARAWIAARRQRRAAASA